MIDYLEQFFLEEEPRREEGTLTASGAAFFEEIFRDKKPL